VVLPDAATLTDIEPALLTCRTLPGLWQGESIKIGALQQYFSGKHYVQIDKGGYKEPQSIPGASSDTVKQAVSAAIKARRLWLLRAGISAYGDDVPASLITEAADLLPPPAQVDPTDLLPAKLPTAWIGTGTTAHMIHVALSGQRGRTLPWVTVEAALDHRPWRCGWSEDSRQQRGIGKRKE